jgi:hypothetical protein
MITVHGITSTWRSYISGRDKQGWCCGQCDGTREYVHHGDDHLATFALLLLHKIRTHKTIGCKTLGSCDHRHPRRRTLGEQARLVMEFTRSEQ